MHTYRQVKNIDCLYQVFFDTAVNDNDQPKRNSIDQPGIQPGG